MHIYLIIPLYTIKNIFKKFKHFVHCIHRVCVRARARARVLMRTYINHTSFIINIVYIITLDAMYKLHNLQSLLTYCSYITYIVRLYIECTVFVRPVHNVLYIAQEVVGIDGYTSVDKRRSTDILCRYYAMSREWRGGKRTKEHVKKKREERGLTLKKMWWLLRRHSELSLYDKLLLYKQVWNQFGCMVYSFGVVLRNLILNNSNF